MLSSHLSSTFHPPTCYHPLGSEWRVSECLSSAIVRLPALHSLPLFPHLRLIMLTFAFTSISSFSAVLLLLTLTSYKDHRHSSSAAPLASVSSQAAAAAAAQVSLSNDSRSLLRTFRQQLAQVAYNSTCIYFPFSFTSFSSSIWATEVDRESEQASDRQTE